MPSERIAQLEAELTKHHQRFRPQVLRYGMASGASPAEAEDLAQEAFLRLFLALVAGDEIHNPQAWLLTTTRNLWVNRLREKARRKETGLEAAAGQDCAALSELEQRQLWEQMLALLAPRERECVKLRRDGLGYDEIASKLGISGGTVGVLLHRARRRLSGSEGLA